MRSIPDIRVLRTVILLRHGQQDESKPGDPGGLTEKGFRQAALAVDDWARFDVHNCGISRIAVKTLLGVQVTALNDTGHLPSELLTYA